MSSDAAVSVTWLRPSDPRDHLERVRSAYVDAFGAEPEGVWSAPGRVNVVGEHTDYNGGLCLPVALPHRTLVAAGRTRGTLSLRSVQPGSEPFDGALSEVGPGRPQGWAAYVAGVPWALAQRGHRVGGLQAVVDGEVPLGAGLSSSAALESATALAVDTFSSLGLAGDDAGRAQLAAACVQAENDVAGAPTGGMDQAASLRCTAGHALLLDCRDDSVRQVPFDPAAHGLALLVIDTQAPHRLVDGQYAERRRSCERAAALLGVDSLREVVGRPAEEVLARLDDDVLVRRTRHVITEIARVTELVDLLDAGRLPEIGPVLDASHTSMRDDFEISCPELDVAVEAARSAGALGARMTGGGFGGSAIALVQRDGIQDAAAAVAAAFSGRGMAAPRFLRVEPGAGGVRVG